MCLGLFGSLEEISACATSFFVIQRFDYALRQTAKIDLPILPQHHRSTIRDNGTHRRSHMTICVRVGMARRNARTLPRESKTPTESR
jgi:hypothetical protein